MKQELIAKTHKLTQRSYSNFYYGNYTLINNKIHLV